MANPPLLRKLGRAERARTVDNAAHQIDTIRAKTDEIIQALANLNLNITGSSSGTSAAVGHAKWTGTYSTSSADGTLNTFLRSDTTLYYPPSLNTAAGATKTVSLSDDATFGALLTSASTFSANVASLKAPNATNAFCVGKYGNFALAGTAPDDAVMMRFTANITDNTSALNLANGVLTQNGSAGIAQAIIFTAINAGTSTTAITGMVMTAKHNNASASGDVIAYEARPQGALYTGTRANVTGFQTGTSALLTSGTVTNLRHFRVQMGTFTSTITNHYGMDIAGISSGTNRYGVNIAAITGGTVATGIEIATHSGGTTRRGLRSGNTNECTANDFLCSTAAKGFITKDGQGSPHYWRYTVASDGTPRVDDTGTSAPTT